MRVGLAAALLLVATAAQAQRMPQNLTPLGPVQAPRPSAPAGALPVVQTPSGAAPVQSQALPSLTGPDPAFAPAAPAQPAAPTVTPAPAVITPSGSSASPAPPVMAAPAVPAAPMGTPIPGDWQPRGAAELIGLDKVTARSSSLVAKVGETVRFGALSVVVRGCVVRAPDQPADAAAFLDITQAGAAEFHGWMIASMPALGVLEDPVYDIRVAGCRA